MARPWAIVLLIAGEDCGITGDLFASATASATALPVINAFSVQPAEVAPGDTVTIAWEQSRDSERYQFMRALLPGLN